MTAVAHAFAQWAISLRSEELPEKVRESIGLRIADSIGLVAAAWDTPAGAAVRRVAGGFGGSGSNLLFDPAPISPAAAALAHGTLIHTLDYDDTFPTSVIHPSSVVFATAWACARDDTPGERVLAAIAAGDEFLARVGALARRGPHARGFQATSVFGPLAAALIAGAVRRREPEQIAAAMGLAGSMSGGVLEFLADGTWSKRLHPGWAAHGGIVADELSAAGFPGPASIVEGRHGLFASFLDQGLDDAELAGLVDGLGSAWMSQEVEIKLFPCAHVNHPFLELALAQRANGVTAEDIRSIVCSVAPWYVPIVCEPRAEKLTPAGEYQARTSLPLNIALAFVDGRVDDLSYADQSVTRANVRALAQRVTHIEDPDLDAGFGARMRITLTGGDEFEAEQPPRPPLVDRVRAKFDTGLSRLGISADDGDALWAAANTVEAGPWATLRAATGTVQSTA